MSLESVEIYLNEKGLNVETLTWIDDLQNKSDVELFTLKC